MLNRLASDDDIYELFLIEYKTQIWDKGKSKFSWPAFGAVLFLTLPLIIWCFLPQYQTVMLPFMILYTIALAFAFKHYSDEANARMVVEGQKSRYLKTHISPLINLLEKYDLYSEKGIRWLIKNCGTAGSESAEFVKFISDLFFKMVFPVATLLFGAFLNQNKIDVAAIVTVLIICIIMGIGSIVLMMKPILFDIFRQKQKMTSVLTRDLEYIAMCSPLE